MKILIAVVAMFGLTACGGSVYGYKESPCACFEYEIFGGEKFDTENS